MSLPKGRGKWVYEEAGEDYDCPEPQKVI